jgi:hypothetical protein
VASVGQYRRTLSVVRSDTSEASEVETHRNTEVGQRLAERERGDVTLALGVAHAATHVLHTRRNRAQICQSSMGRPTLDWASARLTGSSESATVFAVTDPLSGVASASKSSVTFLVVYTMVWKKGRSVNFRISTIARTENFVSTWGARATRAFVRPRTASSPVQAWELPGESR